MKFNATQLSICKYNRTWDPGKVQNVTTTFKFSVIELKKAGMEYTDISEQLPIPRSTVRTIIRRYYNEEHNLH